VGRGGSGTIFFAGCNLHCVFCQNSDISQEPEAWREVGPQELAAFMLSLQARGVENLNVVSPSHLVVEILAGLALAAEAGLTIPVVYNSSGYDGLTALGYLDGVVDIYLGLLRDVGVLAEDAVEVAAREEDGARAAAPHQAGLLAEEISRDTVVNVMDQYFPAFRARAHPPLDRKVTRDEYLEARTIAKEAGLRLVDEM